MSDILLFIMVGELGAILWLLMGLNESGIIQSDKPPNTIKGKTQFFEAYPFEEKFKESKTIDELIQ